MPAYVPPALRGIAGQQADAQSKLSERVWRVKLEYSSGGPFDVAACPEELLAVNEADQTPEVTVRQFELPSEASAGELKSVLNWFAKASSVSSIQHPHGDARCQLLFPSSLSKENRKLLHTMAQGLGLPTFSKGLGDERRLAVHGVGFRDTPEMELEVAAVAARRKAPAPVRERAKQIWRWCQADGGALWAISQGELEEALLAAPDESALPAPVKDLLERRQHGTRLIAAIRAGDSAAALELLKEHPRAAWIREDPPVAQPGGGGGGGGGGAVEVTGYYPLHIAALTGLGDVVDSIASQPGAVEQRDRNYATPLKVAKKAGQTAMVELLLKHGAKDYEVNLAAHKTAAMGIPMPAPNSSHARRLSGGGAMSSSHSHGGSPHVGSPATAGAQMTGSSPHSSSAGSYMAAHVAGRQRRMSHDSSVQHRPHGPGSGPTSASGAQPHQHHGGGGGGGGAGGHHGHHGPSGLGSGQRAGAHGNIPTGRRSLDEHPPTAHAQGGGGGGAAAAAANDPTINPFALLAGEPHSGGSSRRSSLGGVGAPPRAQGSSGGGAAEADADANGGAAAGGSGGGGGGNDSDGSGGGGINRVAGRARLPASWVPLPPIQSGEVSELTVASALAAMGLSAKPALPTAPEGHEPAEEEAGGAAGSGDDDPGSPHGGGDDGVPKKRKTRRGRRGRGNRRQQAAAPTDEAAAAGDGAPSGAAVAAGADATVVAPASGHAAASAPVSGGAQLLREFMSNRSGGAASASAGGSSDHSITEGSESDDGSAGGGSGRTRRGGQPARARRHERRRAARVSNADGGHGNDNGGNGGGRNRRSSGAEYSSFHQGHAYGHGHGHGRGSGGGGGGHQGGHYHVYGGAHQGHADDAASWRRDPAAAPPAPPPPPPPPAAAAAAAAAPAGAATPSPLRGRSAGGAPPYHMDEPRQPAGLGRPPAARRMSAGTGTPMSSSGGGAAAGFGAVAAASTEAPGSPFHFNAAHGPREHVAAGPTAGMGFGFGRGRGRGLAPGGGVPSAPGSPARAPGAAAGGTPPPPPPPPPAPGAAPAAPAAAVAPVSAVPAAAPEPSVQPAIAVATSDVAAPPSKE